MKKNYTNGIIKPIDKDWLYSPILDNIGFTKPPKIIYYELRVWKNHNIIKMSVYQTLKEAKKDYKKRYFSQEENNEIYVEIIKINNLNPMYK